MVKKSWLVYAGLGILAGLLYDNGYNRGYTAGYSNVRQEISTMRKEVEDHEERLKELRTKL